MNANGNEEDGDEAKEDDRMNGDGNWTRLKIVELHHPIPSRKLK